MSEPEQETIRMLPVRPEIEPDDRTAYVERYRPPVPPPSGGRHRAVERDVPCEICPAPSVDFTEDGVAFCEAHRPRWPA